MAEPKSPAGVTPADAPPRKQAPSAAGEKKPDDGNEFETPYLKEVQELFRQIVVTEKNLGLYPAFSKVVKESLSKLEERARKCVDLAGTLRFIVHQDHIDYEEEPVYSEAEKSRSLAFRIYKDGVREITILPDFTAEEMAAFVNCLKDARKVDSDDDDFITLFWEKDCTHIQLQLADDLISSEDLPPVPESRSNVDIAYIQRFKVPSEEKEKLLEALDRMQADQGESTFEISEEEAESIRKMARDEEAYFPLFDFVDILLEVMVRNPDPEEFSKSVKMLRTIIAAVIEDLDFERAAHLMEKLSDESHPGLTESHRRQLREMLETFTDKQTLTVLEGFLEESDKLSANHPIFVLMKAYPRSAAECFCPFLRFQKHVQAMSNVLVHLGTGAASTLAKYLTDPDPLIVRAMIGVLLQAEKEAPIKHIAKALKHPDEGVRVHAAKTILDNGDDSVGGLFLPLLGESSRQLLNLALQFFTKFSCPDAYDKLQSLIKSRNFSILDRKRQMLCFKALLRASYSKGMDFIAGSVLKWTFSLSQNSRDKKSAALMALASCDAKKAVEVMKRFAQKKKNPLAPVARRALKELDLRRQKQAGKPEKEERAEVKSV